MAWRVIEQGGRQWQVSMATERRANSPYWSLVFCFRALTRASIWVPTTIAGPSKAALFTQAERMTDAALLELLAESMTQEKEA